MTTDEQKYVPEVSPPKCPHCKALLSAITGYPYTLGSFVILSVQCPSCGVLLHMGIMPAAPIAAINEAESPIVRPS